jgi:hypothetical protein
MAAEIESYIDDLFNYLDIYKNRQSEFKTEAFLQTYNGVSAVFNALRQQRDKAVEVDLYFLNKIKATPLADSDLREITIQVLITYFESEADTDGQSDKAFSYCRGLRTAKQDVPYFENYLMPLLLKERSLQDNFKLNSFFLKEIARYINKFGRPMNVNLTPEEFASKNNPLKLLELARRRQQLGNDLISDRKSLEFDLKRLNVFDKVSEKNKLIALYLDEWNYREKGDFISKLKKWIDEFTGKIGGAFTSSKYFKLVVTQRKPAYLFFGFIIALFLFLAIYVPLKWRDSSQTRYEQLQQRASEAPVKSGK